MTEDEAWKVAQAYAKFRATIGVPKAKIWDASCLPMSLDIIRQAYQISIQEHIRYYKANPNNEEVIKTLDLLKLMQKDLGAWVKIDSEDEMSVLILNGKDIYDFTEAESDLYRKYLNRRTDFLPSV